MLSLTERVPALALVLVLELVGGVARCTDHGALTDTDAGLPGTLFTLYSPLEWPGTALS